MRTLVAVIALAAMAATSARAQKAWRPEIGIQGGFARIKPTGTKASDQIDLWDLPGTGPRDLPRSASGYGSLFVVVPVAKWFAIEPSLAVVQTSIGVPNVFFGSSSDVTFGLRGNYALPALPAHFYAALGGALGYSESGGVHETQLSLQVALGYRLHIRGPMNGRLEALGMTARKTNNFAPANLYAVLLGVSARLK